MKSDKKNELYKIEVKPMGFEYNKICYITVLQYDISMFES